MPTILANGPEGFGEYWTQSELDNYVILWGDVGARQRVEAVYLHRKQIAAINTVQFLKPSSTALKKKPLRLQELNTNLVT